MYWLLYASRWLASKIHRIIAVPMNPTQSNLRLVNPQFGRFWPPCPRVNLLFSGSIASLSVQSSRLGGSSCDTWNSKNVSSYAHECAVKWHRGSSLAVKFWNFMLLQYFCSKNGPVSSCSFKVFRQTWRFGTANKYYVTCMKLSIPSFWNTSQNFPFPRSFLCFLFSISHPPIGRLNTRFSTTELQGNAAKHGDP